MTPDIDRRCAEIVGWWEGMAVGPDGETRPCSDLPPYSTDISAAMEALNWAIASHAPLDVNIFHDAARGWRVDLHGVRGDWCPRLEYAIVRTIVAAFGGTEHA